MPFALADDKVFYGDNDSLQTKSIVLQGVDGVFTDYVSGTLRAFSLIGSQSRLFMPDLPLSLTEASSVILLINSASLIISVLLL